MPGTTKTRTVRFTDLTLRDAHQCLLATRMRTDDMLPVCEKLDRAGFWSLEVWGGATFDTCLRFLREDPWERLRRLKKALPNTPLQMLLRGQNLVGYRHYADDTVTRFVEKAAENGIQIFRIFDALNDLRNLKTAVKATIKAGGRVEGAFCYTTSPVHTIDGFVDLARRLEDMGCDTICVKDMAGLLTPQAAYDLVKKLKKAIRLPVHLHSHDTAGMAAATHLKAVEAGVDIIDTAASSMAGGTSHPPTETMAAILSAAGVETGLDLPLLTEVAEHFREIRKKYRAFETDYAGIDPNVILYQVPGGMTSNLANQLKEQNALHRMPEVLAEVPRVREDFGFPPLVTPSSQIVGTQATLNVLTGERYKVLTSETKNYLRGLYGRPPAPINPDVQKKAVSDEEIVDVRPADLIPPEWEKAAAEMGTRGGIAEDVLSYILFPKVALEFFDAREKGIPPEPLPAAAPEAAAAPGPLLAPSEFNIHVHGETYHVKVGGAGHPVGGRRPYFLYVDDHLEEVLVESLMEIVPSVAGRIDGSVGGVSRRPRAMEEGDVTTAMPGTVVSVKVKPGDRVKRGDTVLIVEAMKMENEIHTPIDGEVKAVHAKEGESVNPDEVLVVVR